MQQLDRPRRFLHLLARGAAALVAIAGLGVIIGWILGQPHLRAGLFPAGINVKTNTGVALLCCGLSLLIQCSSASRLPLRIARALAVLAILIGTLTLSEHVVGWDLRIDQLLFRESAGEIATVSPNRMGPPASISFTLSGLALLLMQSSGARPNPRRDLSTPLAIVVLILGLIASLGYLYGAPALYGIAKYTGISLFTSVAFMILSTGIILA